MIKYLEKYRNLYKEDKPKGSLLGLEPNHERLEQIEQAKRNVARNKALMQRPTDGRTTRP